MIIKNSFYHIQKPQSKSTFKSADYFQPIKNHSKMICGCCGKKTLPILKYMQVMTRLGLPLKEQIEKGALDYLKNGFPRTWVLINSFSTKRPSESLDKIIHGEGSQINDNYLELKKTVVADIEENDEFKNLYPFAKSKRIREVFFDLNDKARSYMKPACVVVDMLRPLKPYLSEAKKDFFERLEEYSHKHRKKSLSEIIKLPEIAEFHKNNFILQNIDTKKRRLHHFKNILIMIENSNPFAVESFKEIQKEAFRVIYTEKNSNKKEYIIKNLYKDALKKYHCDTVKEEELNNEIKQITKNYLTADFFFAKAFDDNLSDSEIVGLLFENILASKKNIIQNKNNNINIIENVEDSIPNKKTGDDAFGNHYVMCRECNTKTSPDTVKEIIKYEPNLQKNLQEQMNIITNEILSGCFDPRLRAYPIYVTENIRNSSGRAVNLDIIDYCEEILKRSKKRAQTDSSYKRKNHLKPNQVEFLDKIERILQEKLTNYLSKNKKTT